MDEILGLVGALVVAVSGAYYFVDVLRGGAKPLRSSWAVWAVVGLLGFGTSEGGGAGPGAWAAGVDAVVCLATFALSLAPNLGKPGGRRIDPWLAVVAIAGVALWRWGPLSIDGAALCAVACEIPAAWPTLREAWRQPQYESLLSWAVDLLGHGCALAAVTSYSLAALAYPVYAFLATLAVAATLTASRLAGPRTATGTPAPSRDRVRAQP